MGRVSTRRGFHAVSSYCCDEGPGKEPPSGQGSGRLGAGLLTGVTRGGRCNGVGVLLGCQHEHIEEGGVTRKRSRVRSPRLPEPTRPAVQCAVRGTVSDDSDQLQRITRGGRGSGGRTLEFLQLETRGGVHVASLCPSPGSLEPCHLVRLAQEGQDE